MPVPAVPPLRAFAPPSRHARCRVVAIAFAALAGATPLPGHASLFEGETLDFVANIISWVALILVPVIAITVFWIVHVLPEKIAHKRHHPQVAAIQTLCLLSLVFGGLLWPIAWLWAYTRPVAYKVAYGTDKHEDYFVEQEERARAGTLTRAEFVALRDELDAMHARGTLPARLTQLRGDLDGLRPADAERVEAGGGA